MDHHILLLDSNASDKRTVAQNSCSDFVNFLDPPLELGDDEYAVGIKEIQFPVTWYTFDMPMHAILLFRRVDVHRWDLLVNECSEPFEVLKPGRYTDIEELVDTINHNGHILSRHADENAHCGTNISAVIPICEM